MNTFQLSKTDLRILLASVTFLPIIFFASGVYFANSFQPQAASEPAPLESLVNQSNSTSAETQFTQESSIIAPDIASEETTPPTAFTVQAGVFSNLQNAYKYQHHLFSVGVNNKVQISQTNGVNHYRIVLESFDLHEQATQFIEGIKQKHNIELYITKTESGSLLNEIATI